MVFVLLADGFEEVEAICPIDVLKRGGCDVMTVGVTGKNVTGSHGITVSADISGDEAEAALKAFFCEMLVLPGGMPGTKNIDSWQMTDAFIEAAERSDGVLAAICAAPSVLGKRGKLKGKKACCFPGFEDALIGAEITSDDVSVDGRIITSRGAGCAMKFALALLSSLKGDKESDRVARSVIYR